MRSSDMFGLSNILFFGTAHVESNIEGTKFGKAAAGAEWNVHIGPYIVEV